VSPFPGQGNANKKGEQRSKGWGGRQDQLKVQTAVHRWKKAAKGVVSKEGGGRGGTRNLVRHVPKGGGGEQRVSWRGRGKLRASIGNKGGKRKTTINVRRRFVGRKRLKKKKRQSRKTCNRTDGR